ncbi:hydroxyisourate hydrolase [Novosphingobium sp.]|uniref:hydroxyisourate hydrolase n=1 Tax=Novosphingobium sp. TaxID=1874826 RepID=UPI0025D942EA|nr:hydroxyisourate hydrolase [Novosphingobium sp.]
MISLSTHVLDTARGAPAAHVAITLANAAGTQLFAGATDADGRCKAFPGLDPGRYRLTFTVGSYFTGQGAMLTDPPFLDVIVIDFGLSGADGHYHVPLLVSPYGYSTYRGS